MAEHPEEIPADRFTYTRAGRIQCTVCGREGVRGFVGMPDPETALDWRGLPRRWHRWHPWAPWQVACLLDHPWPCSCGRSFPSYVNLWRHIGAARPAGWGRQGDHRPVLAEAWPREEVAAA
ncbi:hypothetical protein ACF1AJ_20570 [Leifsonia sp. NPDC014704]|uniref:hypothetical protein n=1 Tax=Leifsonia sp. NPDC014704 TaxID=3364123 RepID=UPI0036F494AE